MRVFYLLVLSILYAVSCGGPNATKEPNRAPGNDANIASAVSTATNAESQTVTIDSPDGVKLVGSFFESAKPNSPAVLLLHQWQSDRHAFHDFAKRMQAKGINVLAIDGRGFGESIKTADGKAVAPERTDAAVKGMLGDVGAAFEFLSEQKNVDPSRVGIVGASYGSSLAIIYAADNPKVAAIALLSPGLNYFGNMPTEPAIKKYGNRPLYMIAAEDDKESADAVDKLLKAGNSANYSAKVYVKGGHGTALLNGDPEVEADVEKFLTENLKKVESQ